MTKRCAKINQIEKVDEIRQKADRIMDYYEELFELRQSALERDLVGMEEVKTRL